MIVPRNRLLFWTALIALPFSVLAAVEPAAFPISIGVIALLLSLAAVDGIIGFGRRGGISVNAPEVTRLSKDREGMLELRIRNEQSREERLRIGLALPRELGPRRDEMPVALPAESEWSRIQWACLPARRGNYPLSQVYLERRSPLGFWAVRTSAPLSGEVRVYPNLHSERKSLAALFLHRGRFGVHTQRQVGKGREFEKLREYIPGDSFEDIHWKATAKRGHPVTKIFQIERTQEVYVVIDFSRLTGRTAASPPDSAVDGSARKEGGPGESEGREETVLERFVTAALVLALAAEQQGDLFGLMTFADRVETFIRARTGKNHYSACRDALYALQPRVVTPDFDEMATFVRLRLRRRALIVFLTALDDPVLAESFVRQIDLVRRQHLVLVNMLRPAGAEALFSHPNVASIDDLFQRLGGHLRWHGLRELEKVLQRRGVRFSLLENERLSAQLVSQYLEVKQRQLI